ncbi:MAG TPA: sigma-70 family RNA polymerase sigma factor [Pseudonocardia sp.]|nr:sigma-70 family RNA polymerase sigma factor [Pseudonocardia sp.]
MERDPTDRFEADRDHLRAVAYRMLGDRDEADDALQETWLRARRAGLDAVENPTGWLTTVTGRVCLDMLRARRARPVPSPEGVEAPDAVEPEAEAVLAESVGRALLVVLDRLSPAQRVAFVLHDLFAVPFDEIAATVDRSVPATKKLASRARERVRGGTVADPARHGEHRRIVEAFLAASRGGDIDALLRLLAPDVVRRVDRFAAPSAAAEVRGASAVAGETRAFAARARTGAVALVDGAPGIVLAPRGRLSVVIRVRVDGGRISEVEVIGDPARLARTGVAVGPA